MAFSFVRSLLSGKRGRRGYPLKDLSSKKTPLPGKK
jgi:hypothetical protein